MTNSSRHRKPTKQELRFARHLQKVRRQQGFTQEELAEKLNVSTNWIGLIEIGYRLPNLPMVFRIARILKVGVKDLFPF